MSIDVKSFDYVLISCERNCNAPLLVKSSRRLEGFEEETAAGRSELEWLLSTPYFLPKRSS